MWPVILIITAARIHNPRSTKRISLLINPKLERWNWIKRTISNFHWEKVSAPKLRTVPITSNYRGTSGTIFQMILGRVSPRSVKLASPLWTAKEFLLICHKEQKLQMTNRISIFRNNQTTNQSSTWFTKDHNLSVLMQKNLESNRIDRHIIGCHLFLLQTSSNWTIRSTP